MSSIIIIIIIAGTEVEQLISIDCAQLYFLIGCAGVDLDLESPYLILSYLIQHITKLLAFKLIKLHFTILSIALLNHM